MLETLERSLGDLATWTRPRGGLFIWVHLPEQISLDRLQQLANAQEVEFSRGRAFHARNEDIPCLRLSYGYSSVEDIREGTRRLGDCIRKCL